MKTVTLLSLIGLLALGCRSQTAGPAVVMPKEIAVSEALPTTALQSAAIWIHPTDPAASLLFVPNATRGLQVHKLDGTLVQHIDSALGTTSVGVIYNFSNGGAMTDLVAIAHSTLQQSDLKDGGVSLLPIDAKTGKVSDSVKTSDVIPTFKQGSSPGLIPDLLCTYRSHVTGRRFFFVFLGDGAAQQWEVTTTNDHKISATLTRSLTLGGELSGCIADDDAGAIYISDRMVGVREFNAEPDMPLNDHVAVPLGTPLKSISALSLYCGAGGEGYLLVVNEVGPRGATRIDLFDRLGDHPFIASIAPQAHRASGLAITNQPTVPEFPAGVLAVSDAVGTDGSPTFRLYSWGEIAGTLRLLIDPSWSSRPALYRW